jgi:PAS domain S-box-containing protein
MVSSIIKNYILLLLAVTAALVFILDSLLPLGIAAGVLYSGVVFLSLWAPRRQVTVGVSLLCTALLILGYFVSTPGESGGVDIVNRCLEALAIGLTACLTLMRKSIEQALIQAHTSLERRVQERTTELAMARDRLEIELVERSRAEALERSSKERFELVVRATNDAIWDWNLETNRIWVGGGLQKRLGYQENVGDSLEWWMKKIHPDDREDVVTGLHMAIHRGEDAWSHEYRFRRADGTFAWILDRGYIVRNDSSRAVRMVGSMMDVTDRKSAEKLLQESQRQYRRLF